MAYRLRKETPQLRMKIEGPNGQADISPETSGKTWYHQVAYHP